MADDLFELEGKVNLDLSDLRKQFRDGQKLALDERQELQKALGEIKIPIKVERDPATGRFERAGEELRKQYSGGFQRSATPDDSAIKVGETYTVKPDDPNAARLRKELAERKQKQEDAELERVFGEGGWPPGYSKLSPKEQKAYRDTFEEAYPGTKNTGDLEKTIDKEVKARKTFTDLVQTSGNSQYETTTKVTEGMKTLGLLLGSTVGGPLAAFSVAIGGFAMLLHHTSEQGKAGAKYDPKLTMEELRRKILEEGSKTEKGRGAARVSETSFQESRDSTSTNVFVKEQSDRATVSSYMFSYVKGELGRALGWAAEHPLLPTYVLGEPARKLGMTLTSDQYKTYTDLLAKRLSEEVGGPMKDISLVGSRVIGGAPQTFTTGPTFGASPTQTNSAEQEHAAAMRAHTQALLQSAGQGMPQ